MIYQHAVNNNVNRLLAAFSDPNHPSELFLAKNDDVTNILNDSIVVAQVVLYDSFLVGELFDFHGPILIVHWWCTCASVGNSSFLSTAHSKG